MNPYQKYVSAIAQLTAGGKSLPLGGMAAPKKTPTKPDAPVAMIFSPHPDDECIIGGLPLRLLREAGMRVVNVAVTLGSNSERRAQDAPCEKRYPKNCPHMVLPVNAARAYTSKTILQ